MVNSLTKKRAWEMYSFLIGTIIGLLIIGAMFFGYGIYKSSTSNSQIFTAVQNGDLNKLSSLRLNNSLPINTEKVVVFKKGDNTVDLSALTDTGTAYAYVVSNDPAVNEGVINKTDFFSMDDDKILSKGFITPGNSTVRVPKYFGNPNTTTASGYTIFETSDTAYFSNTVASNPIPPAPTYTDEACFGFHTGFQSINGYNETLCWTDVNIPPTIGGIPVLGISSYTFYGKWLTSVIIPEWIVNIEYNAFASNQLTSIVIPNTVISIPNTAFSDNILSSVTIGTLVQSIGYWAFQNNQLTSLSLPPSVTSISDLAFDNNPLSNIQLYDSVNIWENMVWLNNNFRTVYEIAGWTFTSSDNWVTWIRN